MAEIRTPEEKDRQSVVDLMRISFNAPPGQMRQVAHEIKLHRMLCAYEGGRMAAMALAWDLGQWFGGRSVPMSGIGAVAAWPEDREKGLAPECLRALLRRARDRGQVISTLFPSRAAVYRRLGYEYAGILAQHRFPIAEIPAADASSAAAGRGVEELTDADMDGVRACYGRFAAKQSGLVECGDEDWWRMRVVRRWNQDTNSRAVVFRGAGGIEGYATFQIESQPDTWNFRIVCTHLIAETPAAFKGLLAYFRSFRGLGQLLVWYGPPTDPVSLVGGGGAETLQPGRTVRYMTRLLDVKGALEARGYPPVAGEAAITVKDELFPDNDATYTIVANGGRVSVERDPDSRAAADRAGGAAIPAGRSGAGRAGAERSAPGRAGAGRTPIVFPIGALSALYTGYASPHDLVRAGLIEGGEATLSFLADLFRGQTPWATDFF